MTVPNRMISLTVPRTWQSFSGAKRTHGCCKQPGYECAEAGGEDVTFEFQVIATDGRQHLEEIQLRNHTSCECQTYQIR